MPGERLLIQLEMEGARNLDRAEEETGVSRKRAAAELQQLLLRLAVTGPRTMRRAKSDDAAEFLKRVKEYFNGELHKYNEFVLVLKSFKRHPERDDALHVIARAKELFQGDRLMLQLFNKVLPPGYKTLVQPLDLPQFSKYFICKLRARGETEYVKSVVHLLHIFWEAGVSGNAIHQEAAMLFRRDPDLLEEFTFFLGEDPADSAIPTSHPVVEPAHQPPQQLRASVASEMNTSSESLARQSPSREPSQRVRQMHEAPAERRSKRACRHAEDIKFGQPLTRPRAQTSDRAPDSKDTPGEKKDRKRRNGREAGTWDDKGKGVSTEHQQPMRVDDVEYSDCDWRQVKDSDDYLEKGKMNLARERARDRAVGFALRPSSELELCDDDGEQWNPSYTLAKKKRTTTHRSDLANSVLNDTFVLVKPSKKFCDKKLNKYEEPVINCEDDQFECDMHLLRTTATAKRVAEYLQKLEDRKMGNYGAEEVPPVETFLSAIHMRCIQQLYGKNGRDMLEMVRENPSGALPVILPRLVQKVQEWADKRGKTNKGWSQVYKNCFHRSLDHRVCCSRTAQGKGRRRAVAVVVDQTAKDQRVHSCQGT